MKTTKVKPPKLKSFGWKGTDTYEYLGKKSFTSTKEINYEEMLRKIIEKKNGWFCGQPFINLYVSNYGVPHPCSNTSLTVEGRVLLKIALMREISSFGENGLVI